MNVFTTDHPMVSEPSPALLRFQRRFLKGFLSVLVGYPLYLLLLGPFWALDGRGAFLPEGIRYICYLPTAPIWAIPHVRGRFQRVQSLGWMWRSEVVIGAMAQNHAALTAARVMATNWILDVAFTATPTPGVVQSCSDQGSG